VLLAQVPKRLLAIGVVIAAVLAIMAFAPSPKEVSTGITDVTAVQSVDDVAPFAVSAVSDTVFDVAGFPITIAEDAYYTCSDFVVGGMSILRSLITTTSAALMATGLAGATFVVMRDGTSLFKDRKIRREESRKHRVVEQLGYGLIIAAMTLALFTGHTMTFLITAGLACYVMRHQLASVLQQILYRIPRPTLTAHRSSFGGLSGLTRPIATFAVLSAMVISALMLDTGSALAGDAGLADSSGGTSFIVAFGGLFLGLALLVSAVLRIRRRA
jgi:hypothetical protein